MRVKMYGTRGSLPVAGEQFARYGGNTTCIRVYSSCLPEGWVLCIDAGTGFGPMSSDALAEGMKRLVLLQTHYHHDHTQGFPMAPPIHIEDLPITVFGPMEGSSGPKEVYQTVMAPPHFPVPIKGLLHHVSFRNIESPTTTVIVFHPDGGMQVMEVSQYLGLTKASRNIPFKGGNSYPLKDCLVVRMFRTQHPEQTVTYRFDERGKRAFCFLTDEECRAAIPVKMRKFIAGVDLLVQDAQYGGERYENETAGYGHGTPAYAVTVAKECGVNRLGLTHHDPQASDDELDRMQDEALAARGDSAMEIFMCKDFQELEV